MVLENGFIPESKKGIVMSKLCGALATDGTIYKQEKLWNGYKATSYYFELTDEWEDSVKLVQKWVKSLIGKDGSITPNTNSFRYRIGSKLLLEQFHSLGFPYGKKASIVSIPKQILSLPREYRLAFVGAAIIFDGTVKLDGTIEFSSISKKLRDQIVSILREEKIHVWEFEKQFTKWSKNMKYGFSSRSFDFFINLLEGPKKNKLKVIRYGKKLSFQDLLKLFPQQEHSKLPFLKIILDQIKDGSTIYFRKLKQSIEEKYNISFHRNTLSVYLNLLTKSRIIKRISNGLYKIE